MINKEFALYKESLEVKELGFDEDCFGYYDTEGLQIRYDVSNPTNKNSLFTEHSITNNPKISAPTYSQSFRWFRKNHQLSSWVYNSDIAKYFYTILFNGRIVKANEFHKSHEDAELACLKKLIEIVKKK